jgi:galactose mutarotase-like enzyme
VPDHGDLWDTVFEISGSAVIGHGGGYTFQRSISEVAGGLRLGYRAEATGEELPFLWAAHPQFVAPRGTRVVLPEQVTRVVDVMADPIVPMPMPWAVELSTIDTVPLGAGRKVYVDPDSDITAATLLRPEGARLELTRSSECQYLGLWFDNSQYNREPVIALEPATGYFDSVERAADSGRVSILEPGRPLEWWIEVRCS